MFVSLCRFLPQRSRHFFPARSRRPSSVSFQLACSSSVAHEVLKAPSCPPELSVLTDEADCRCGVVVWCRRWPLAALLIRLSTFDVAPHNRDASGTYTPKGHFVIDHNVLTRRTHVSGTEKQSMSQPTEECKDMPSRRRHPSTATYFC